MKISIAQINPTVGNIESNKAKIIDNIKKSNGELIVFPELVITGYPPKDLLIKKKFIESNINAVKEIAKVCEDKYAVVGFVNLKNGKLYNAAALLGKSKVLHIEHKINLPNYDVFDEKRYFTPGDESSVFEIDGYKIGVNICEDIWVPQICKEQRNKGANLIINISASPFHIKKWKQREELLSKRAKEINLPIIYANLVGGQDDLVFDGRSYFFNNEGKKISEAKSFEEDLVEIDLLEKEFPNPNQNPHETEKETKEIYEALILGLKDYVQKNGFKKVIIGLSGGIDSALTAAIAVKALGKENVLGITMPSKFSSKGSVDDSIELAKNLEINCETIPIKDAYDTYLNSLYNQFLNTEVNVAEENIQARIRGNFLMAISNKFNYLVLSTGNKSELSVGYATLYGDMCGGIAVISDLLKTKVYNLCKYINNISNRKIIPLSIIEKEPSAELREDQKDTDSLPPYDVLDSILESYVEEDKSTEEIIGQGYDPETVKRIIKLVDRNEYKRNQAAIGIKITPRAFGSGRRMPITNRWND